MSLLLFWNGSQNVDIQYTEVVEFDMELNKLVAMNTELNKIVTMTAYAELEDNS